jgi:phenylpropionate dioxygenase-like ring-hydroxylating dioxygenase large terminal subunit
LYHAADIVALASRVVEWVDVLASDDVPPATIVAVSAGGADWVVWRGATGRAGVLPRQCPHLDFDLADAVVDRELVVCSGHAWCFDADGHAGKHNLVGRLDRKDDVAIPELREHGGRIELRIPPGD